MDFQCAFQAETWYCTAQKLGSGHLEGVYERATQVGLRLKRIRYESQKVGDLQYEGHCIGYGCPDLLVGSGDSRLVVELKVVAKDKLGPAEKQQLRNYMELLNIPMAFLSVFQSREPRPRNRISLTFQTMWLSKRSTGDVSEGILQHRRKARKHWVLHVA
jgi:GxxExxY protein